MHQKQLRGARSWVDFLHCEDCMTSFAGSVVADYKEMASVVMEQASDGTCLKQELGMAVYYSDPNHSTTAC